MTAKISGLYSVTNKLNGEFYIGSSNDTTSRWVGHKSYAKKGSTKCPKFYNALRKYGPDNFEFKVLLRCDPTELYLYEQAWLDANFDENNYNTSKCADAPMRGRTLSSEHVEKMLISRKYTTSQRSKETSSGIGQRISAATRGKKRSKEFCERRSGENHHNAKRTLEQVTQIRTEWETGNITQKELAKKHVMPLSTLKKIIYHYSWK